MKIAPSDMLVPQAAPGRRGARQAAMQRARGRSHASCVLRGASTARVVGRRAPSAGRGAYVRWGHRWSCRRRAPRADTQTRRTGTGTRTASPARKGRRVREGQHDRERARRGALPTRSGDRIAQHAKRGATRTSRGLGGARRASRGATVPMERRRHWSAHQERFPRPRIWDRRASVKLAPWDMRARRAVRRRRCVWQAALRPRRDRSRASCVLRGASTTRRVGRTAPSAGRGGCVRWGRRWSCQPRARRASTPTRRMRTGTQTASIVRKGRRVREGQHLQGRARRGALRTRPGDRSAEHARRGATRTGRGLGGARRASRGATAQRGRRRRCLARRGRGSTGLCR